MQQAMEWKTPTDKRLAELLQIYECVDVVAPVDCAAYAWKAVELITKGAATRTYAGFVDGYGGVQTDSSLFDEVDHSTPL